MNFKYYLGAILTVPLLPIMYVQGKRIMARVPKLSEAKAPKGSINFPKSRKTMQLVVLGESTIAGVSKHTRGRFHRNASYRIIEAISVYYRLERVCQKWLYGSKNNQKVSPKNQRRCY